jgi:D-3-phosphoglycerate dehydrogenase
MKVLVSDDLGEAGIKMFEEEPGLEVDVKTGLEPGELKKIIGDYDALVIRSATEVNANLLQAAKNLKVVGRAGIGLDNVDIPEATKHGVVVMNTPTGNMVTTAEHTIAMMMALTRNIPWGTSTLKAGKWEKKKLQGREIYNKVFGIIGFGKIGAIVADRARGLKMQVIVHDPYIPDEQIEKAGFEAVSIEDLYRRSDYITVHVPKLKDTLGLINKKAFSEPPGACPLFEIDRVICTPHLGASTLEAQTNVAVMVAEQIIAYLKNKTVINAVNVPAVSGDLLEKLNPYLTLADRMGCLLTQLSQGPIKEILIEYTGDFDDLDLSPVTTAVLKGMMTPMIKDDVNFVNARVLAKERGVKITEAKFAASEEYLNLITVKAISDKGKNKVAGTIFGRKNPRVVNINNFRLELEPVNRFILIHNHDKPGAIGSIGTLLGDHNINISRMRVGLEENSAKTMIFLRTDTPIPEDVIDKMRDLPLIISVAAFEL